MSPSVWWVVVGVALMALEMATGTLFALCLGAGAVLTAAFSCFVEKDIYQYSFFAFSSVVLTMLSRPLAAKFSSSVGRPSNVDALIGKTGLVEKLVDGKKGVGFAKIEGELWRVETADSVPLRSGEEVTVLSINGNTLKVRTKS